MYSSVARAEAERGADRRADDRGRDRAGRERDEDLHEALDQHAAIHAQDAADDDRRDEQVQEVGRLREFDREVQHRLRQHVVVRERRRHEGREDRGRADVAQERQALAQFRAGEAEEREHRDRHRDLAGHLAGHREADDQREQDEVDGQRNDADADFHQFPPAFRPEARARVATASETGSGWDGVWIEVCKTCLLMLVCLHGFAASCAVYYATPCQKSRSPEYFNALIYNGFVSSAEGDRLAEISEFARRPGRDFGSARSPPIPHGRPPYRRARFSSHNRFVDRPAPLSIIG